MASPVVVFIASISGIDDVVLFDSLDGNCAFLHNVQMIYLKFQLNWMESQLLLLQVNTYTN